MKSSRAVIITALVAALAIASSAAEARPLDPKVYCLRPGVCFAAAFQFTDYLTTGPRAYTQFTVYLQNLQGSVPKRSRGTPMDLNTFSIRTNNPVDESRMDVPVLYSLLDNQREGGTAVGRVRVGDADGMYDDLGSNMRYHTFGWYTGLGIAGCDLYPNMAYEDFRISTCPRRGHDGWLRLDFRLYFADFLGPRPARFDDFQFTMGNLGEACGVGAEMRDRINHFCREFAYDAVATPEPATLLLLAPGLVVLGGVRRLTERAKARSRTGAATSCRAPLPPS